jgi:hypothetical protein
LVYIYRLEIISNIISEEGWDIQSKIKALLH